MTGMRVIHRNHVRDEWQSTGKSREVCHEVQPAMTADQERRVRDVVQMHRLFRNVRQTDAMHILDPRRLGEGNTVARRPLLCDQRGREQSENQGKSDAHEEMLAWVPHLAITQIRQAAPAAVFPRRSPRNEA